jgi:hypothetical protein
MARVFWPSRLTHDGPYSFSLSPFGMVSMVPNLVSSPQVLGKGASVFKIQAFLLQVKLPSALYCLEQLVESMGIQTSATKYIVNFDESDDLMDESD